MYDDLARPDIAAILDGFHPQVEWHEVEGNPYQPDGIPFRGREEVLEKLFTRLEQDWSSFVVTPRTINQCATFRTNRYGEMIATGSDAATDVEFEPKWVTDVEFRMKATDPRIIPMQRLRLSRTGQNGSTLQMSPRRIR